MMIVSNTERDAISRDQRKLIYKWNICNNGVVVFLMSKVYNTQELSKYWRMSADHSGRRLNGDEGFWQPLVVSI